MVSEMVNVVGWWGTTWDRVGTISMGILWQTSCFVRLYYVWNYSVFSAVCKLALACAFGLGCSVLQRRPK